MNVAVVHVDHAFTVENQRAAMSDHSNLHCAGHSQRRYCVLAARSQRRKPVPKTGASLVQIDNQTSRLARQVKRDVAGIFDQRAKRRQAIIRPDRGRDELGASALPAGAPGYRQPGSQDLQLRAAVRPGRTIRHRRYADIRQGVGRVDGSTLERGGISSEQVSVPFHIEREPAEFAQHSNIEPDV